MSKKDNKPKATLDDLQLKMLRVQQGVWYKKERIIILFEGVDAAGKGGAIRKAIEKLDPRGFRVHPIGPPSAEDQAKHYLYRFWTKLPAPGTIAIFDRSWYGRVLVERVEKLIEHSVWKRAYKEINHLEKLLTDDGIYIIKIFLTISKAEQLKRFEARLNDPYKQWKITIDDLNAREKWNEYQKAITEMLEETSSKEFPWHVIDTDDKEKARYQVLKIITTALEKSEKGREEQALLLTKRELALSLKKLEAAGKKKVGQK